MVIKGSLLLPHFYLHFSGRTGLDQSFFWRPYYNFDSLLTPTHSALPHSTDNYYHYYRI